MKKRGVGKATRVAKVQPQHPPIPNEYKKWVKNRTVDLSEASPYYKKGWERFHLLVSAHFQDRGMRRYELDQPFFNFFCSRLRQARSTNALCTVEGANLVAKVLCYAALSFTRQENQAFTTDHLPRNGALWPNPGVKDGFLPEMEETPPKSESWRRLGDLPVPTLDPVTLYEAAQGKWELGYSYDNPLIRLSFEYGNDRNELPRLTIVVEGEPVCLLMKQKASLERRDDPKEGHEANDLWEKLVYWMAVSVGLKNPTRGRPRLDQGGNAAFLFDHCGRTWWQVVRQLCEMKHTHSRKCSERLRKQAENYWRRLNQGIAATLFHA